MYFYGVGIEGSDIEESALVWGMAGVLRSHGRRIRCSGIVNIGAGITTGYIDCRLTPVV